MMEWKRARLYAFGRREEVDSQVDEIKGYASRNNFEITDEYKDYEELLESRGYREFGTMVSDLQRELKCFFPDQRNRILFVESSDILKEYRDEVQTLGKFDLEIHAVRDNQIFIIGMSSSGTKTLQLKCETAIRRPSVPFGYSRGKKIGTTEVLIVKKKEAGVVSVIYYFYRCFSLRETTCYIKKFFSMYHLSKTTVYRILKNPIYCGDYIGDDRYRLVGSYPIVTRKNFNEVQMLLKTRKQKPKKRLCKSSSRKLLKLKRI